LALLSETLKAKLEFNVISYNSWTSACWKIRQWQRALWLLSLMREVKVYQGAAS